MRWQQQLSMVKPKVLVNHQDKVTFLNGYLRSELIKYFDIVDYNPDDQYMASKYTVLASIHPDKNAWADNLIQDGAKLVYDCLWENHLSDQLKTQYPNVHVACCKSYFWINEYYLNQSQKYNNYYPDKNYTYLALLPIRQSKPHRKQLLTALAPWLDSIIYSTVDQGRFLPNDQDELTGSFQRHFDPDWYNSTYFSIVAESITCSHYNLHVTEKTFKPIAYYHPFVVFGQTGVLAYLHEMGFETFENLFDESYDTEQEQSKRLSQIVENVANFESQPYDDATWQKLNHNHNLFYNRACVEQMFVNDIVNPILEYAETQ